MAKRHTLARMAAGVSSFAIVAVMAMSPTLASAQNVNNDKDKDKNGTVSEVVVTAQFTQQNLQQTPIAITAVTGAMLDARGQTRISDITAQAPNVQLQQNPAGGGNSMRAFIRGVGQADQDPAVDPGVGIYVDDVYFASVTGSVFDLLDLDRVEILRGPQGTLSGMNSLGGSVKLYSKKPTGEGGFVEASTGSLHRTDVRGSADFTVVPDKLFMRISGVSRHHDGYVTRLDYACVHPNDPYVISGALPRGNSGSDCKIGTQGNQDMTAVRGALRWTPNSNVEVNLIGDYTNDDSETQAATLLKTGEIIPGGSLAYQGVPYDDRYVPYGPFRGDTVINDPYVSYANFNSPGTTYKPIDTAGNPGVPNGAYSPEPKDGIQSWGVSNTIDWRLLEKLSLKSITGYRHYVAESTDDNDGSPVDELLEEAKFTHKQFSEELRLNGQAFGDKVDYTVGGIYFYQKTIYAAREHDPFIAGIYGTLAQPTFDFLQDDPTVVKTEAAFAHAIWSITDKLSLASGIRYTHEHKDYTFYRLNLDGQTPFLILSDPANPLNGRTGTFAGSHVDYRADLSYQVTDDVMTYAQFSTGFKGGGISPRPYFPQQILGFGPEKLQAYEVGLKSQLFEHRLRVNLAAFYNDYKDYQATPNVCVDASGNPAAPALRHPGTLRSVPERGERQGEGR